MSNVTTFAAFVVGGVIGGTIGYLYASYTMMKGNLEHIKKMCDEKRAAERGTPHDPKNT